MHGVGTDGGSAWGRKGERWAVWRHEQASESSLSLSLASSLPLLSFLPVALGPIVDKWEFNSIRARLLLPLHGRVCGAPPPIYRWVHSR